ncbi:helix-turn-helix domain-containing protein [Solobacterium moorei]|uniref:helix-turn-helix domain-containing protein n=1 Tax=Solobacterium moorei TaxID=102148 RepID=UPI000419D5CA|nr:helix-turn-helix transcriptional regulator [Solobacterium moorei]BET22341.1 hypothetical protein RGT18_19290 [Solobacterium moorei]
MFYILERELKERNITRRILSKEIGIAETTLSLKLNGKRDFTLSECNAIKEYLNTNLGLDELFATKLH